MSTLGRRDFLDLHKEVSGLLISPHCYEGLTSPLEAREPCACETHSITGLTNRNYVLGRQGDIKVGGDQVSKKHACISIPGLKSTNEPHYRAIIRDVGSKNGTYVNNLTIGPSPKILNSGDLINLANDVELRFIYLADFYDRITAASEETKKSNIA